MGFEHDLKRFTQSLATFTQALALCDSTGDFFHPAYESAVFRPNDGVVSLSHDGIVEREFNSRQVKLFQQR